MTLCVSATSSVSCDLRVFVHDTADHIAAPGTERVEVDDGVGQRLEWCGLPERAVPAMFVMADLGLSQYSQEMPLIPDQGAIEQLPSASANPPLYDRVRRGACTGLLRMRRSAACKTSSKAAVNFVSWSRIRNLIASALPSGSISKLRAC